MSNQIKNVISIVPLLCMLCAACTDHPEISKPDVGPGPASHSVTEETCERLDACNILSGSVEECIQGGDAYFKTLPQNQAGEVELAVKQCLAHPSCDGLAACLAPYFGEAAVL